MSVFQSDSCRLGAHLSLLEKKMQISAVFIQMSHFADRFEFRERPDSFDVE